MKKWYFLFIIDIILLLILLIGMYITNNTHSIYFNVGWFMLFYVVFQCLLFFLFVLIVFFVVCQIKNRRNKKM